MRPASHAGLCLFVHDGILPHGSNTSAAAENGEHQLWVAVRRSDSRDASVCGRTWSGPEIVMASPRSDLDIPDGFVCGSASM